MRLDRDPVCRFARLMMTSLLSLAWSGALAPAGDAPAHSPRLSREDLNRLRDRLDRSFKLLEDGAKQLPRDTFDLAAVAQQASNDPVKIFAFVRDQTDWVPYQGVLRGPVGTLMDRLGNSLDRSLLLAALLRQAGQTVRLAHATLPEDKARELMPKLRTPIAGRVARSQSSAPTQDPQPQVSELAKQYGLTESDLRQPMDAAQLQSAKLAEDLLQRSSEQTPTLAALVAQHRHAAATSGSDDIAALREHWWVQRQNGGSWVDLDPLLPDARPGQAIGGADKTVEFDKDGLPMLDAAQFHTLRVRVVVEQCGSGAPPHEQTVIDKSLRPSELIGQSIALHHVPLEKQFDASVLDKPNASEAMRALLLAQKRWAPVLMVGKQMLYDGSFSADGQVQAKAQFGPLTGSGGAAGGAGDVLGGDPAPAAAAASGELTAEWVEYEIAAPGRATRAIRREVFDLLGPAARAHPPASLPSMTDQQRADRALALSGQIEMLPLVGNLSSEFVANLTARALLADRAAIEDLLRQVSAPTSGSAKAALDRASSLTPVPGRLYAFALARQQCSPVRDAVYLDGIDLVTYHRYLRDDAQSGLRRCEAFDIVANGVAVCAGAKVDPFTARLTQGVVDTNAESLVAPPEARLGNIADVAAVGATQWVAITRSDDPAWAQAQVSPELRARIEADLKAGCVALVPAKTAELHGDAVSGWWRVDPASGEVLGMGNRGWGQEMIEYNIATFMSAAGSAGCGYAVGYLKGSVNAGDIAVCALMGLGAGAAVVLSGWFGAGAAAQAMFGMGCVLLALSVGIGGNS